MTCNDCGMTVGWDCTCDPELTALIDEAQAFEEDQRQQWPAKERPNFRREFNNLTDKLGLGRRLCEWWGRHRRGAPDVKFDLGPGLAHRDPAYRAAYEEQMLDGPPASAPDGLLPDTFIERAVQVALKQEEPNEDATVLLSAFEASFIRRRRAAVEPPDEEYRPYGYPGGTDA